MTGHTEHEAQIQAFGGYLEEKKKPSGTIQGVLLDLGQFADFMAGREKPFAALSEEDVNDFVEMRRAQGNSEKLIHRKLKAIKSFYKFLEERGESEGKEELITESRGYVSALPRPLTIDEMKRFIIACTDLKRRAIFTTLYETGMRPEELARLTQDDVDYELDLVSIKNKDGEKDRVVALSRKVKDLLKKYIRQSKNKTGPIFSDEKGPIRTARLQVLFVETAKEAKLEGHIALSSLRRSLAAHMIEQGIDLGHVAQILGLKNTNSLEALVPAGGVRANEYQKFVSALDL
jgi:integrase/recombinase XerD